jgi:hypothetical protein
MNDIELDLVNNVAQKLEIYIRQYDTTVFALAKKMKMDKQSFYRIVNRKNVPTIFSLFTIASSLNCTIQELIAKNVFIDIDTFTDIYMSEKFRKCRIYISNEKYESINGNEIVGIAGEKIIDVYYICDQFISDGTYIIKIGTTIKNMDIISVGSKFVIAEINSKEERFNTAEITPIAKRITVAPIFSDSFCRFI